MSVRMKNWGVSVPVFVLCLFAIVQRSSAQCGVGGDYSGSCVSLEWRPANQTVIVGQTAEIGLYAVSVNAIDQPVLGMDVILVWDDPNVVRLAGNNDNGPYGWMNSFFPDDRALDRLNADCGLDIFCDPFSYMPYNDGNALYFAAATPQPAQAPSGGLLVTTFQFEALSEGIAQVAMPASCEDIFGAGSGCHSQTRVAGLPAAGVITASIGPPATVEVLNCLPPLVVSEGARYLAVTPAEVGDEVAVRVVGVDLDVSCILAYVQANGALGTDPVYLPPGPSGWDTVHVRGGELVGGMSYMVLADCDPSAPQTKFSDPVAATTWRLGDVNNDGVVDFVDITMIVDGFRNVFGTPFCCTTDVDCTVLGPLSFCNTDWLGCQSPVVTPGRCQSSVVNLELKGGFGCVPDGVVDFVDITAGVDAFRNVPDPCRIVCP